MSEAEDIIVWEMVTALYFSEMTFSASPEKALKSMASGYNAIVIPVRITTALTG